LEIQNNFMKKNILIYVAILTVWIMIPLSGCGRQEGEKPSVGSVDNETIRTIMQRKSVRAFTDEPIPAAYMEAMLKAAMAAPTGSNIQPWYFVVLTDKSKYEHVFENNFNMRIFNSAAAVVVFCADTTVTRPPRDNPDGAPVTRPNGTWRDDLGACTENFLLAAESLGLGAVWTAAYPYSERYASMKRELGLPDPVIPYCAVALGWPAGDNQPKDKWKPDRIHYERW
jgi:nitroreductase